MARAPDRDAPGAGASSWPTEDADISKAAACGHATHPISHVDIPRATFCSPNVASFGLTEEQARGAETVYGDRTGVIKIVGDKQYGELLGGHIVGTKATELIQELVNVKLAEAATPRSRAWSTATRRCRRA